jgi:hypothetical protein
MEKDDAKFTVEGNPGTGNTYIKIDTAYNVNPNAKDVYNTFVIGNVKEAAAAIREAQGAKSGSLYDHMKEPEENIDCTPIRTEILNYVSRVRPLLKEEAKSTYMKMWEDILDLPEVAALVYKPGNQWGTNFNRNLVANILYHLRARNIYTVTYKDNYNGAVMTEYLEGNKEHSVKHALREEPSKEIRDAIDAMLAKKY